MRISENSLPVIMNFEFKNYIEEAKESEKSETIFPRLK